MTQPKNLLLSALVLVASASHADAALVETFADIHYWVGSGSNQAAFVVDWSDGRDPWAWGYRWNGTKNGADMLAEVVRADPRLYAKIEPFDFGDVTIGIGLDRDADGFTLSDGTTFPADGLLRPSGTSDGAVALDADDSYGEGWNTGFWSYWIAADSPYATGGGWTESQFGAVDRVLVNGSWDGWRFAPNFASAAPGPAVAAPAAVPEPSVTLLFGGSLLAAGAIGRIRNRWRAQWRSRLKRMARVSDAVGPTRVVGSPFDL